MSQQLPSNAPCWPTPERELLLEAGLCETQRAMAAWSSWRSANDLDDVSRHTRQLLPLVYRNLAEAAADDPEWSRIGDIYRRNWANNQLLFGETDGLLEAFRSAGFPAIVLKGMALARTYYPDAGCRPMDDVDVLVPPDRATDAVEVLNRCGWTCPAGNPGEVLSVRHSAPFGRATEGSNLDLHWGVLWQPSDDADFWERARPLELTRGAALALAPTDQLLHVRVHGTYWSVISFRWVADAVVVIRSGEVDWDLFAAVARDHDVTWGLADMLVYLRDHFGADADNDAIAQLRATPLSRASRRGHEARASTPTYPSVLRGHWDRYRRIRRRAGQAPTPWGFAAYMRLIWRESYVQLAVRGVRRALRGPTWNRAAQR